MSSKTNRRLRWSLLAAALAFSLTLSALPLSASVSAQDESMGGMMGQEVNTIGVTDLSNTVRVEQAVENLGVREELRVGSLGWEIGGDGPGTRIDRDRDNQGR